MAYFNGFPNYQYYPQYQQTQQIQNGGLVPVPNIDVARNYHVAPGTSVTFVDENSPYVYTKTRGFSQFEPPVFEKMRLVKEEDAPQSPQNPQGAVSGEKVGESMAYATKSEIEAILNVQKEQQAEIDSLKAKIGGTDDE